jgi:hypothetical protein
MPTSDVDRLEMQVAAFRDHVWRCAVDVSSASQDSLDANLASRMAAIRATAAPDDDDEEDNGALKSFSSTTQSLP